MKSRSHLKGTEVAAMLLALVVGREAPAQGMARLDTAGKGDARATSPRETSAKPKLSDEAAALFREALNAGRTGDWSRAAGLDLKVVKESPDFVLARLHHGAMLILNNREAEGRKFIDQALGRNPDPQMLMFLIQTLEDGAEVSRQRESPLVQTYSKLAFERAKALGYATSANAPMLSLIAKLALDMGDNNTFRMATASLVRDHQGEMETHYFNAIRAARDRDWVTGEDEIRRAGDLGLPRDVVDQVLASGLQSRASIWRYLYYSLYAALAWATGLAILFIGGKLLSAATLRSAQADDPNATITPIQRGLRRAYRAVINVAALYYYISLPFVALLAIGVATGLIYGVLMLPRIPVKLLGVVFLFGLAMLSTIWSSIRSLFVRVRDDDPGPELTVEEAPRLWALARDVAAKVGTRPVDAIFLTPGAEVAVFERGRWLDKARDRARRSLILGLGVVEDFRIDPFRAVLAHEYGHFLHRDTAGGDVALRVNRTIGQFAMAMIQRGSAQWWNIGWQFVRLYNLLFRRITHGASRLQEINADRVAARAFGKEAFEEGLRHVIRRDVALHYQQAVAEHQLAGNSSPHSPSASTLGLSSIRAEVRRQIDVDFDKLWDITTSEDDTHPCPTERIRLLQRLAIPSTSRTGGCRERIQADQLADQVPLADSAVDVEDLFADPARLRAMRAERLAKEVREHVDAKQAYIVNLIAQLDDYLAQHPGLVDPLRDRGNARMELGDYQGAVRDFTEAIRLDGPYMALYHYGRGLALSKIGDLKEAADELRKALALDPTLEQEKGDGRAELGGILFRLGDSATAIAEYDRALALDASRLGLYLRRGEAYFLQDLAQAEADFTRALDLDPRCAEALAGRARARSAQGQFAEAEADARQAICIEPELGSLKDLVAITTGTQPV